jgi:hypothetical protein
MMDLGSLQWRIKQSNFAPIPEVESGSTTRPNPGQPDILEFLGLNLESVTNNLQNRVWTWESAFDNIRFHTSHKFLWD